MRLLIESKSANYALPAGVKVVERLPSGSVLVDATPTGVASLKSGNWSVRELGFVTVTPRGVDDSLFVDVGASLAAARARRRL